MSVWLSVCGASLLTVPCFVLDKLSLPQALHSWQPLLGRSRAPPPATTVVVIAYQSIIGVIPLHQNTTPSIPTHSKRITSNMVVCNPTALSHHPQLTPPARPPNPLRLRRSPRLRLPRRRQAQHRPHVRLRNSLIPIRCARSSNFAMRFVLT